MKIRVLLFATLAESLGRRELDLDAAQGATVGEVLDALSTAHAAIAAARPALATAVNASYAAPSTPLRDGDVLALIPPVSGG